MKTSILILLLFITLNAPAQKTKNHIGIIYYNQIDPVLKRELIKAITAAYNCTVTEIGPRQLPNDAFYKPRNRYRADKLLTDLKTSLNGMDRVIGITIKDISTTKGSVYDWGIMGLGYQPGKACVISTYRLRTPNKTLLHERTIKVALHELGHTFGIPHCTYSATCYMEAAEGTVRSVDRETRFLCAHCKSILNQ